MCIRDRTYTQHADNLGLSWIRLHRVSWRAVQPNEGDPYDWSVLSTLEAELVAAREAGFTPMVIVHHSPRWATINQPFATDCGACLLYTSDAADDLLCVDLGGRRIIKKKIKKHNDTRLEYS